MSLAALDPALLECFVAVAERRSFSRAATALNRTQSAVSMQIKRLEARSQVPLFRRGRAGVVLTAPGEALLDYARRILALNGEALARLRANDVEGEVRLGAMDDYGTLLIPPLLARFAAAFPSVRVELQTGLTASMPSRLGTEFDLVVAMHPAGQGRGEFLRRETPVWAAGAGHATPKTRPLPLALNPQGCLFRKWAMAALDRAGIAWRLAFVGSGQAAVEAVAAQGLAVTVLKAGTFPARLRRLGRRDGLPPLPAADIRLHRAPRLSRAGEFLAAHLAAALRMPV